MSIPIPVFASKGKGAYIYLAVWDVARPELPQKVGMNGLKCVVVGISEQKRFAVAHYHVKYKYLIYLTLFLLETKT